MNKLPRREVLKLFATLGAATTLSSGEAGALPLALGATKVSRQRLLLGGMVRVTVMGQPAEAGRTADAALDAVEQVEQELSLFLPGSALCRLNREGRLVDPPQSLRRCLSVALEMADASGGAFDPTAQPLLELISRSFAERGSPPSAAELSEARSRVGHHHVLLEADGVRLEKGSALTLNGVAKGYAMDQARLALLKLGASSVLAAASGDIAVETGPWRLALRDPLHPDQTLEQLWSVPKGGTGASGGYMNTFSRDGTWHHIVDPRTGTCPNHLAGVVVHASTAVEADALSTASFVLEEREALALADRRGTALLAIRPDGTMVRSRLAPDRGL